MKKINIKQGILKMNDDIEKHIKQNRKAPKRTICELHRFVFKELKTRNKDEYQNILDKLKFTYKMGKYISKQLHRHNAKKFYHDYWDLEE